MDEQLKSNIMHIFQRTYEYYAVLSKSHIQELFRSNRNPIRYTLTNLIEIPEIKSIVKIPFQPCIPKTNQYLSTYKYSIHSNHALSLMLPFDYASKTVMPEHNILEPYLNSVLRDSSRIENDQLFAILCLHIMKYIESEHWENICLSISDMLQKKHEILISKFKRMKEKLITRKQISILKLKEDFCKKCYRFFCLQHIQNVYCEQSRDYQEPKHPSALQIWKTKLFAFENNILESGLWALNFSCPDPENCGKILNISNITYSANTFSRIDCFLKLSMSNPCFISLALQISCPLVAFYIKFQKEVANPTPVNLPKSYQFPISIIKIPNLVSISCGCSKVCKENCSCFEFKETEEDSSQSDIKLIYRLSKSVCDKYCECSIDCEYRFLGCFCPDGCSKATCLCMANNYECDPFLCRMCSSLLSLNSTHTQLCGNLDTQKKSYPHTALSLSTLENAGLGFFTLEKIKNGQCIYEYSGEIVSDSEAGQRGVLYDYNQHSYLFGFNEEFRWSIDSMFFGNKLKYSNHKSHGEENCRMSIWNSHGDLKLLMHASKDIEEGEELCFNYGYALCYTNYQWYRDYEEKFEV